MDNEEMSYSLKYNGVNGVQFIASFDDPDNAIEALEQMALRSNYRFLAQNLFIYDDIAHKIYCIWSSDNHIVFVAP